MEKQQLLEKLNKLNKNTLMETLQIEFIDVGNDFLTAQMPVNSKVHQHNERLLKSSITSTIQ